MSRYYNYHNDDSSLSRCIVKVARAELEPFVQHCYYGRASAALQMRLSTFSREEGLILGMAAAVAYRALMHHRSAAAFITWNAHFAAKT
jgi:hypothetical protein